MDELRDALLEFVRCTVEMAKKKEATEAQMSAMASVANTLIWERSQGASES